MEDYNWEEILDSEGNITGFQKVAVESDVDKENRFNAIKASISKDKDRCISVKAILEAELAKFLIDIPSSQARDDYAANMQTLIDKCSEEIDNYSAAISKVETDIYNIYAEMEEVEPPTPPTPDPEEGEEGEE
jgi:hypothetical protein